MAYKTVAPGRQLDAAAAASYERARRDGLPAGITSALREHSEQRALFLARYTPAASGGGPYGDVRWYQGKRYVRTSPAGSVAIPGSQWSRHERGLSLDLPEPARTWMRAHGHRYGWIKDLVPGEPWHFEHQAARDTRPAPAITPQEVPSMILRLGKTTGPSGKYLLVSGGKSSPISHATAKAAKKSGIPVFGVTAAEWKAWA